MNKALPGFTGMTFGADPELFVADPNGDLVCPEGLIPGDKEEPYKVDCGAVQVDGMAAEFNIDPVDNYPDWRDNIKTVRNELQKMLPHGYTLVNTVAGEFTKKNWDNAPEHAKILGCSPDFDAWRLGMNPAPRPEERIRFAGGHIHFGWTDGATPDDKDYYRSCVDLVRQLDWYLASWSLSVDKESRRRSMYGKAGSMRFKPYGVEYRTLSNFWLNTNDDPYILLTVWNRIQTALADMSTFHMPTTQASFNKELIKSINSSQMDPGLQTIFYNPIEKAVIHG